MPPTNGTVILPEPPGGDDPGDDDPGGDDPDGDPGGDPGGSDDPKGGGDDPAQGGVPASDVFADSSFFNNAIEFVEGFGYGFFVDGAWGTITGVGAMLKGGFGMGRDLMAMTIACYFYVTKH